MAWTSGRPLDAGCRPAVTSGPGCQVPFLRSGAEDAVVDRERRSGRGPDRYRGRWREANRIRADLSPAFSPKSMPRGLPIGKADLPAVHGSRCQQHGGLPETRDRSLHRSLPTSALLRPRRDFAGDLGRSVSRRGARSACCHASWRMRRVIEPRRRESMTAPVVADWSKPATITGRSRLTCIPHWSSWSSG